MKRLTLSSTNQKLSGVCGGIGEYLGVDPTLIRVIFIILLFISAFIPLVIAYIVMAAIIPKEIDRGM